MKERRSANKYSSHAALVKVKWAPGSRPNELVCVCSVAQSCPAPLWPRGLWSPPRSCVHGIFQAQLSLILADSLGSRTSFWVQRDQETGIRLLIWNDFESITPLLKKKKKRLLNSVYQWVPLRFLRSRSTTQSLLSDATGFTEKLNSHERNNWKPKLKSTCYKGRLDRGSQVGGRRGLNLEVKLGWEISTPGC